MCLWGENLAELKVDLVGDGVRENDFEKLPQNHGDG